MKKLILHIGNHKTATTSIQKFLLDNKNELAKKNYFLFQKEPNGELNEYGHSNHWIRHEVDNNKFYAKFNLDWLKVIENDQDGTYIFSAEHLSWIFEKNEIVRIYNKLKKYFEEIKVICYIRRQDQHLLSHHQQGSKHYNWCEHLYFGCDPQAYPELIEFDEYLDYYRRLSKWGEVFGDENIIIRPFEKDQLKDQNIIADFLDSLNIELPTQDIRVNESNDAVKTVLGHILNEKKISHLHPARIELLGKVKTSNKLQCSKEEALAVYNKFRLSNLYLNERFNISKNKVIFSEDFSAYPDVNNTLIVYKELISQLTDLIVYRSAFLSDIEFAILRDSLIELSKTDAENVLKIAKVLSKFRLKSPILTSLINELNVKEK